MALHDRFDALTPVATGSPGRVWRARRRDVGDVVTVTQLDLDVAEQAPRVAVRLAQVDHPHLVHVLDVVNEVGRTLLIEQWVDGATLDRTLGEGGEISAQHAIAVVSGILDALTVAHDNGVAHGDLRPEVVLIEAATGAPRLFGFGLGQIIPGTGARGTAETISPEVVAGRPADPRSDVYGAGCLLFWLLTGQPPFPHATAAAILDAHVRSPMPWLPGAPSEVRQVVRVAMAKDPDARYSSTAAMADALHAAASRRYGEGWDDVSPLAARAAEALAALGPVAARSQGPDPAALPPVTSKRPSLPPAAPRPPSLAPLPAAPLPDPTALSWSAAVPAEGKVRRRRAEPVALDDAPVDRDRSAWPAVLLVLLVLGVIAAAGGLYWHRHHKTAATAGHVLPSASTQEPTLATESGSPGVTARTTASPGATPGSLAGRWTIRDTVTATTGTIQGPGNTPLKVGDVHRRTYVLTWRCSAPGTCSATVLVQETGASLSLTGDGKTFHGSVRVNVACGDGKTQPLTAEMTLTVSDAADGRVTAFTGTTSQTYAAAGSCAAASAQSSLSGTRT